jgi:ketol-acid reductoisomerase
MAKFYYDADADLALIQSKRVGMVGYGSQGHAHALNLRDSGVEVGVATGPRSRSRAEADGFRVVTTQELAKWADVLMMMTPDTAMPAIFANEIAPHFAPGRMLLFCHGFNIRFQTIQPPPSIDVAMVAPKGVGQKLREIFVEGGGLPGLIAVHHDASGQAQQLALSYAKAIGCTRAGVMETTFAEETETDLFGEQVVLCGGVSALIKAGFDTLVAAGYQPEIAYFECLHELKLVVDLLYRGGLTYMREAISDTAEFGDYTSGPRIITDATRREMRAILRDIQDGSFARKWIEEDRSGRANYRRLREADRQLLIEKIGAQLRSMMPFVQPVVLPPE